MNRPDNLMAYDELDLKLGIKSSLPHVKGTLALSVLLWECADHPSELVFSEQKDKETVLTQELRQWLSDYLSEICEEENIDMQISQKLFTVILNTKLKFRQIFRLSER